MSVAPIKDDIQLTQLASVFNFSLGSFIGAHWPDCAAAASAKTLRDYNQDILEQKLLKSVPLTKNGRTTAFMFYATDDVASRDSKDDTDPPAVLSDMVAILNGFRARFDGRSSVPLSLANAIRFLTRRGHDLDLVARSGPDRLTIARFIESVLRVKDGTIEEVKHLCTICADAFRRNMWSMAKFDKSVQDEVWLGIFGVFMRTGDQHVVRALQLIIGVDSCRFSALFLWLRFENLVAPSVEMKTRFVELFRLHEMIMGARH